MLRSGFDLAPRYRWESGNRGIDLEIRFLFYHGHCGANIFSGGIDRLQSECGVDIVDPSRSVVDRSGQGGADDVPRLFRPHRGWRGERSAYATSKPCNKCGGAYCPTHAKECPQIGRVNLSA